MSPALHGSPTTNAPRRSPFAPAVPTPATAGTGLGMGDRSCATRFQVGDAVTVVQDVAKAGINLKGRTGAVIATWEKCDVDPTCCCAEFVDEGFAVRVRFATRREEARECGEGTFAHYFAEAELEVAAEPVAEEDGGAGSRTAEAFDGLSCQAFKLDKLSMGAQARRIAAFEESRENM